MHTRLIFTAIFIFLLPLTAQATVAGNVEYSSGEAWIERSGEKISLHNGDMVDAGDVIVTALSGRVQLRMQDGSKIFVGRESHITIDKYEMKKGSLFSGSFNMLWGKVRFLVAKLNTGGSSFSVQTKTATIGVRGTQFAVLAKRPSVPKQIIPTTVMLFEGAVVGKSISGNMTNIKPGKLVVFNPTGKITKRNISKQDLKQLDIKPLEFTKTPAAKSNKPKGKPSARTKLESKPVERTKQGGKPEAKPVERTRLDVKPDGVTTTPSKLDSLGDRGATPVPAVGGRVATPAPAKADPFGGRVAAPVPTKVDVPDGRITAPAPKVGLPVPKVDVPGGRITAPAPKVGVPAPKVSVPAPKVSVPAPKVSVPAPKVSVPAPKVSVPAPKVSVPVPKVSVPAPRVSVPAPKVSVPAPRVSVPAPRVVVPVPKVRVPVVPTPRVPVTTFRTKKPL